MKLLATALLASVALCNELKLQLRNIETGIAVPWGLYDYDSVTLDASTLESPKEENNDQGSYCVDAIYDGETIPCFSFLDVESPLHYNLVIDVHDQELKKLSLIHNPEVRGIEPLVRNPVKGPEPPAVKLKKTTKTYQDKKANKEATTAQFSSEDNEDENKTWFQKNWKVLLIGLIVYNVIAVMNKQGEVKQEVEENQKPLGD
ncbi:hypothetical protein ZYGR_0AD02930 [Zygosaccharomyces rouxii]|uniref:ZYRO0G12760p n=2 Tax=Zygosaccharomyces rouxii TaxID=4956 RepID=C5E0H6_ZYGRC|nr:uncharacterized protein ZYRO0G12760g [Zygosaccharomyces rouxii]KAH9202603.1 hypothetical protein LQ764DRAFT_218253 [Zygosaccharomyces rouxii]GAV51110.1 hypothetical protein ZYGR_0AD02930 [Zygosaccharomyces rouxii]CAR29610.1 ZYRO0G12760p [Zygosaccharomyces rouxii]